MQPTLVSKIFLFHDKKVLTLTRSNDEYSRAGGIDIPGGHVDAGETPSVAVCRELGEEVGLAVAETDITLVYSQTEYAYDKNIVRFTFVGELAELTVVTLSREHQAYAWLDPTDERLTDLPPAYVAGLHHALAHNLI